MDWSIFLAILSLFFIILSAFEFFQLWSEFKKLKIGDMISNELVHNSRKKIILAITFLGIGSILSLIGIMIKPF
ncbi:MAG: hypothetical protein LPK00_10520 [Bacillaceae bacterium]|nr:hypothetical protein [Bacillaceae bacterium]